MAFSRAAAMSSLAWIALSMAAISRTLVEGTWLKMLRYQCTMHLCQAASGKNSAALSVSPMQASEVISRTPFNPRSLRCLRNALQPVLSSFAPSQIPENLPITALVHADRNQQRDVAHLASPAALEHDAVEINIRVVALDRTIAPRLDGPIDLLVQVRHCRGRHPRAPQSLRNVLDPAHRYPGQIHLDQRLFDRALAPPIALDDRRLERLPAQLRNPQPHLAGLGLKAALVVAGAGIATCGAALIALRIAQPIRLGIEQGVQRLLHGAPHHPVEVALDPLIVNRDDVVQRTRYGGSLSLAWLRLATSSSA